MASVGANMRLGELVSVEQTLPPRTMSDIVHPYP